MDPISSGVLEFCDSSVIDNVKKSQEKIRDGVYAVMGRIAKEKFNPLEFMNNPNDKDMILLYNKVRLGTQLTEICKPHYETNF